LVRWTRFTWDLSRFPPPGSSFETGYVQRPAAGEEEESVTKAITSAFSLDSDWSDHYRTFRDRLQVQVRQAFEREAVPAVVILHGTRIIGASVLNTEPEANSHLLPGPCVLLEYRNRGLGSALLHESLAQLARAGLKHAYGISKENVPATKFVYPKFGSTQAPCEYEPVAAVS